MCGFVFDQILRAVNGFMTKYYLCLYLCMCMWGILRLCTCGGQKLIMEITLCHSPL